MTSNIYVISTYSKIVSDYLLSVSVELSGSFCLNYISQSFFQEVGFPKNLH